MADTKTTNESAASTPLTGAEIIRGVQGGGNVRFTAANILASGGAPGSDTQLLFNDGGVIAGDSGLTYNKATDALTVGEKFISHDVELTSSGQRLILISVNGGGGLSGIGMNANAILGFTSSATEAGSFSSFIDTALRRDAANTLAQRNGTTAQIARWYGSWTDASNGDWLEASKAAGGAAYIRTVKNGTGTASTLSFGVAGTNYLTIDTTGNVNPTTGIATPAAGSTAARLIFGTTAGFGIYYGSGAPTVSAAQGSIYLRSDGSGIADRLYVNTTGSTTWTNFVSAV